MKRVSFAVAAAIAAALTGCVTIQQVQLSTRYDPDAVTPFVAPGQNQLTGSALIRQMGGGVVTCAGYPVHLIPATPYAKEWAGHLFGAGQQGFVPAGGAGVLITNVDPRFVAAGRTTTCNAQGFFTFADLADGEFYAFTSINWRVGDRIHGGSLMKAVTVRGGQKQEIVMAP
ncbi:MAG: hypothetical protein V4679_06050 [Pseudomonadota bacterium]